MLLDELKNMKAELEEKLKAENAEEKPVDEKEEEITAPEEEKPEEKPIEKPIEKVEEKPLDDAGYARLRREAAAAENRAKKAEQELEESRRVVATERPIEEQPAQAIPSELQPLIERHRIGEAEREFAIYENKAKQLHPEYGAVASEYAQAMYQSIKLQNRGVSELQLNEMTKKAILIQAGEFVRAGYENPVEEMFHYAKELGFTGKSYQKQESKPEPKEEKLEPDMSKVAENRKRSSGMAATNGRSEGLMTLGAAADLSAAEWAKLPVTEKRRLMYGN